MVDSCFCRMIEVALSDTRFRFQAKIQMNTCEPFGPSHHQVHSSGQLIHHNCYCPCFGSLRNAEAKQRHSPAILKHSNKTQFRPHTPQSVPAAPPPEPLRLLAPPANAAALGDSIPQLANPYCHLNLNLNAPRLLPTPDGNASSPSTPPPHLFPKPPLLPHPPYPLCFAAALLLVCCFAGLLLVPLLLLLAGAPQSQPPLAPSPECCSSASRHCC